MVFVHGAARRFSSAGAQAGAQDRSPVSPCGPAAADAMRPNRWGDSPPRLLLALEAEALASAPARALAASHALVMEAHPGFWLQRLLDACATATELVARADQVRGLSVLATKVGAGDDVLLRLAFLAALHIGPSGLRGDVAARLGDAAWSRAKLTSRRPVDGPMQRLLALWVVSYRNCTELDLGSRCLNDADLQALVPSLRGMARLQVLRMLNNRFTKQAVPLVDSLAREPSALLQVAATTFFGPDRLLDNLTSARQACQRRRQKYEAARGCDIDLLQVRHAAVVENEVAFGLTLALEAQAHGAGVLAVLRRNEPQVAALRTLDLDQVRDWSRDDLVDSVAILGRRARSLRRLSLRVDTGPLGARDDNQLGGWRRRVVGSLVGLGELRELSLTGWRFAGQQMQALFVLAQELPFWFRLEGALGPCQIPVDGDDEGWRLYAAAHQTRARIGRLLGDRESDNAVGGHPTRERERRINEVIAEWAGDLARYHRDTLRTLAAGPPARAPFPAATRPLRPLCGPPQAADTAMALAQIKPSRAAP